MDKRIKYLNGLTIFIGVWLVLSCLFFPYISLSNIGQQLLLGMAVIVLGTARLTVPNSMWASWINVYIGLWLIIATWMIPSTSDIARWNELIVGLVLVAISYASAKITIIHETRGVLDIKDDK